MFLLIDCKNRMSTKATLTLATKLPNGVSQYIPMCDSGYHSLAPQSTSSPVGAKNGIDYGDVGM